LVAGDKSADANAQTERDQGRTDHCARSRKHHCGIVLRDKNHLRIRGLDDIDRLRTWLYDDCLLLIRAQCARGVGLRPQSLNGIGDCSLISGERLTDGGVVVDILRHHLDHLRKIHQCDKCGIEPLLLGGIGKRRSLESWIRKEPIVDVQDLLRGRGCRHDLREQGIGIERDGGKQLIQLLRRKPKGLGRHPRFKFLP